MNNRDTKLSKALSWILRHGAAREGLAVSSEGFVKVSALLHHASFGGVSVQDIEQVVVNNNKQRFELRINQETKELEIKARQGHSIQVTDDGLIPILKPIYNTVVHGTYLKYWANIRTQGLSCMTRQHIHLSKGTLDDATVISGIRPDVEIYIFVNLEKALKEGFKFFESHNGVILTRGNINRLLPPQYFLKVTLVKTGYPPSVKARDLLAALEPLGAVSVAFGPQASTVYFPTEAAAAAAAAAGPVLARGAPLTLQPCPPPKKWEQFPLSKQKDAALPPERLDLSGDFHAQLDALLRGVRLAPAEVLRLSALYADLEATLASVWPGCVALPFGSITTGLGTRSSDADCFMQVPPAPAGPAPAPAPAGAAPAAPAHVNLARRALKQQPQFAEVFSIPHANTPIVKLFHVPTATKCDVSFKTPLGFRNSRLVARLLHQDPRLIPVAVVVKYWAKVHQLTGTGRLTNYALIMMLIFYLQQPPAVLPAVRRLQKGYVCLVDGWDTGFSDQPLPPAANRSSIAQLLGGFFQFYSTFNFEEDIVCPYLGAAVKKKHFKSPSSPLVLRDFPLYHANVSSEACLPLRAERPFCVQDPFEHCHNVASCVGERLAAEIRAYVKVAADAYEKEKANGCQGYLKTILFKKIERPKSKGSPEFRIVSGRFTCDGWAEDFRRAVDTVFKDILKLELVKVDTPDAKTDGAKLRERFTAHVQRRVWKRRGFARLYAASRLPLAAREARVTDEVLRADPAPAELRCLLDAVYRLPQRQAVLSIRLKEGDACMFADFGRFFSTTVGQWLQALVGTADAAGGAGAKTDGAKVDGGSAGVDDASPKAGCAATSVKDARKKAGKARTSVEDASTKADATSVSDEDSSTNADAASISEEDSSTKSDAAIMSVEDASTKAETAIMGVEDASTKADAANMSGDDTSTKASKKACSASTSAQDASTKAVAAITSVEDVSTKADAAITSVEDASTKADIAIMSAEDASTKADIAIVSAEDASTKADIAIMSAEEASTKAHDASMSGDDASTKASKKACGRSTSADEDASNQAEAASTNVEDASTKEGGASTSTKASSTSVEDAIIITDSASAHDASVSMDDACASADDASEATEEVKQAVL